MQEEVENRTLTLVVSGTKFTGRLLKAAISKYMAHCKEKKLQKQRSRDAPVTPHGKQTVKQIIGQNQGISNIEITDPSIKEFEKIARKYGVDLSLIHICPSTPYGSPGDEMRLFLTEDGYQAALQSQQRREIKIKRYARVIEGLSLIHI